MVELSGEHLAMVAELKAAIHDEMVRHEATMHDANMERAFYPGAEPKSASQIIREHDRIVVEMAEVADTMLGKRRSSLMGGGRASDGVVHMLEKTASAVVEQGQSLAEQGKNIKYLMAKADERQVTTLRLPATVWVAIISALGVAVVAIIEQAGL